MAKFNFTNLDTRTRELMCSEIQSDIEEGKLYKSESLNTRGSQMYEEFLLRAVYDGDDELFAKLLAPNTYFNTTDLQPGAAKLLCQNEFNKYYIRAICLKVIALGVDTVVVYRAKPTDHPQPEVEAKVGTFITASELLADLRANTCSESNVLPEIGVGLCVKI